MTLFGVRTALGVLLLSGSVLTTTSGKGKCTVRRFIQGDRIFPGLSDPTLCADRLHLCRTFYNAAQSGNGQCSCVCSAAANSTFDEKIGTCVRNSAIRNVGCGSYVYFIRESQFSRLRVLSSRSAAVLNIRTTQFRSCTILQGSSEYFTRQGWASLSGLKGIFPFQVQAPRRFYTLTWNGQSHSALFGHIIKLDLKCQKKSSQYIKSCLLFKMEGDIDIPCNISSTGLPPVPSHRPPRHTTSKAVSLAMPPTSQPYSTDAGKTTEATGKTDTPTQAPTSNVRTETNASALPLSGTQLPVTLIIAVSIAVTAMAIACTAGLLFLYWRRKRKHPNREKAGSPTYAAADSIPLHDVPDEHVYATVGSPKHLYQPLTLERNAPMSYDPLMKQSDEGYLEPVENGVEDSALKDSGYTCPGSIVNNGDTMTEPARYASADDVGSVADDCTPLGPTSPLYFVLEGKQPSSPRAKSASPSDNAVPEYLDLVGPDC